MRIAVFISLILVAAPLVVAGEPSDGLLYKLPGGTTHDWLIAPGSTMTPFEYERGFWINAPSGAGARSPSFEGAQEMVLLVHPVFAEHPTFSFDAADGTPLLVLGIPGSRWCVATQCETKYFAGDGQHISLQISEDGWALEVWGHRFATGTEDLRAIDHVTIRGRVFLEDVRIHGSGPRVDTSFQAGLDGFAPIIEGLLGGVLPPGVAEPYEIRDDKVTGLDFIAPETNGRSLLSARTPGPRWVFQSKVNPWHEPEGFALIAGLDEGKRTLWRVGLSEGTDLTTQTVNITFLAANDARQLIPVGDDFGWMGTVAAIGDADTGLLTLRIGKVLLDPIMVPSLVSTAFLAFGDADVDPTLDPNSAVFTDDGTGGTAYFDALVAAAPAGIEV